MYNRYTKLKWLEGFIANIATKLKKAAPRFEEGVKYQKLSYEEVSWGLKSNLLSGCCPEN